MEAAPAAPFIVSQPDFLLEVLIVALDAPAQLGPIDQPTEADPVGQGREPVLGWLLLALRPLDQQPFVRSIVGLPMMMADAHAQAREARAQLIGRALPPSHRA